MISNAQFTHLLETYGYLAILLAIIADSFGVPIPGEIMLLLASVYAGATHHLALLLVAGAAICGAIIGDNTTFFLGRQGGHHLLWRYGRVVHIDQRRMRIGQYLFQRYGGRVVAVGRLIPVLHIWTALLAGTNRMAWSRFALYNAGGAIVWAMVLSGSGYLFGRTALRFGGLLAELATPMAIAIALIVMLLLRMNERRLQAAADAAVPEGDDEPQDGTGD